MGMTIAMRFDMRSPQGLAKPLDELYAVALELAEYADSQGFDIIRLTEHHGLEDGYNPSPVALGAAIAARTSRVKIRLVLVLPLYDPIKLAEDLAVLDQISSGRLEVLFVAGYVSSEFAMFGRSLADRPRLVEEGIAAITSAWAGEPVHRHGTTFHVTPTPLQRPRPRMLLGGSSDAAARRAARVADGFAPTEARFEPAYRAERERLGLDDGLVELRKGPLFVHVSEDPEADWQRIAPHALHESNSYAELLAEAGGGVYAAADDPEELRASGVYQVLTPDESVALAKDLEGQGAGVFTLHPLMGGLDPELAWSGLRLFVTEVLPRLRGEA